MTHTSRIHSFDYLKGFSIIAVVYIHCTTITTGFLGNTLNQLSRFAVPLFFMISGYLYQSKRSSLAKQTDLPTSLKSANRLGLIFLIWSFLYLSYPTKESFSNLPLSYFSFLATQAQDIADHPFDFLINGGQYHLWFLSSLIQVILIVSTAIYLKFEKPLLLLSLILFLLGAFFQNYNFFFDVNLNTRNGLFLSLFCFVLGSYCFDKKKLTQLPIKKLFICSIIFQLLEILLLSYLHNDSLFHLEYSLSTPFIAYTLLVLCIKKPNLGKQSFISTLGENSLGIYVIHIFILNQIIRFSSFFNSYIWLLIGTTLVIIISHFTTRLLFYVKNFFLKSTLNYRIKSP